MTVKTALLALLALDPIAVASQETPGTRAFPLPAGEPRLPASRRLDDTPPASARLCNGLPSSSHTGDRQFVLHVRTDGGGAFNLVQPGAGPDCRIDLLQPGSQISVGTGGLRRSSANATCTDALTGEMTNRTVQTLSFRDNGADATLIMGTPGSQTPPGCSLPESGPVLTVTECNWHYAVEICGPEPTPAPTVSQGPAPRDEIFDGSGPRDADSASATANLIATGFGTASGVLCVVGCAALAVQRRGRQAGDDHRPEENVRV